MSIRNQPRRASSMLALALCLSVVGHGSAVAAESATSTAPSAPMTTFAQPIAKRAAAFAISQPVSSLPRAPAIDDVSNLPQRGPKNPMPRGLMKPLIAPWGDLDAALSRGGRAPNVMPPTIVNFEGINNTDNGALFGFTVSPPDTVGDIGRTHYVQAVNLAMRIYNLDGTPVGGAFKMSDLFAALGTGNACANGDDDGDPIILYDHLADRWLLTQFATEGPPFHQCIAISRTGDPTGTYYVYDFEMPLDKFNDYPHLGVWPDGYYMTDNQFNAALTAFVGAGVFSFERAKMLVGDPSASFIYFDLFGVDPNLGGMLPSDLDGAPPPAGTANVFAMFTAGEFGDVADGLRLWEFRPNYATPASSTFTELTSATAPLPVAAFDPTTPSGRTDVPQPGTTARLDTIADRLMHRLQYRNFGTHHSLVSTHTVDVSGDPSAAGFRAGVRYYELRKIGAGAWTVHEQATHAPADTINRWMGSAALDRQGNLAVGFSAADAVVFPGIRYAGRLASDPPGGLAQGEAQIIAGSRSQTSTGARWGDYASMNVDPIDDCTFWFTTEYYGTAPAACGTATQCWQTRTASFKFPSCTAAPAAGEIEGRVTNAVNGNPVVGAMIVAGNGYTGVTDASGDYSILLPPQTIDVVASAPGYASQTAAGVVVASAAAVTRNFVLVGTPTLALTAQSFSDPAPNGNNNGVIDVDECPIVTTTATNSGGGNATSTSGVLSTSTANVTVLTNTASFGTIAPGASATGTPSYVLKTSAAFQPGTPIDLSLALTATENTWTQTFSFPTGTPANAPVAFASTAAAVPIPDNNANGGAMPVVVSGLTSRVSKVTVALRGTHTWQGDLSFVLVSPDGTRVGLVQSLGGSSSQADNFGTDCPAGANDLIFDDAAAAPIGAGATNLSGTFRPAQPLSTFTGLVGNGTWQLIGIDGAAQDTGTIECVTINIDGYTSTAGGCTLALPDPLFRDGFENP